MIHNLKRYIVPIVLLSINTIISLMAIDPSITAKILYSNVILALFSLLAINYKDSFGQISTRRQTFIVIGTIFTLGLASVFIFINFIPVSLGGDILNPNFFNFLAMLLLLNILLSVSSVDWEKEEVSKQTVFFILKLLIFIIFLYFLRIYMYLAMSKETGLLSEHQVFNFPILLGLAPIILLLILPNYSRKAPFAFGNWMLVMPVVLVAFFFMSSRVTPSFEPDMDTNTFTTDQYLSYLDNKKLLKDDELQANLDLSFQERKEFVELSKEMARYPLPENLNAIKFLEETYWDDEDIELFIQTFGFNPVTYLTPIENTISEDPEIYETISLTDRQINPLLKEKALEMIEKNFSFNALDENGLIEREYDFEDMTFKLQAEIQTQPEQYWLSLKNQQEEILISLDLFDIIARDQGIEKDDFTKDGLRRYSDHLERLIFPFEDNGRSGYLVIPQIKYLPINKKTDFTAFLALEQEEVTDPKPVRLSMDWTGRRLTIDEEYQAILPFSPLSGRPITQYSSAGKSYPYHWASSFTLADSLYRVFLEIPADVGGLRITITDFENLDFSVLLDEEEVSSLLEEDDSGKLTAKRYQVGDFAVDVLLAPSEEAVYEGILFIND